MRKSNHHTIRAALRGNPDGMTAKQLSELLGIEQQSVRSAAATMPDVYIDRWVTGPRRPAAVWCAVDIPPNCPPPPKS